MSQHKENYKRYKSLDKLERKRDKIIREQEREQQELENAICVNCLRRSNDNGLHESYKLKFHRVTYDSLKSKKFKLIKENSNSECMICDQCKNYLVDGDDNHENIWPSFTTYFLTQSEASVFDKNMNPFHSIYDGPTLWKVIPQTMRPWWIESLKNFGAPQYPYRDITLEFPTPIFVDKTIDVKKYNNDFDSGNLKQVINAMNNIQIINRNILCPWSCSCSYTQSGRFPFDLILVRCFPKIMLDCYSDKKKYRFIQSSWSGYFQESFDNYTEILLNKNWKIQPSVIIDDRGIHVLTCKYHDNGNDKLYCFPPRSPNGHILNAMQSDQLAHCVRIPRISRPTKALKYSTKFSMVQCRSGFTGVDTMDISTHSDFSKTSELLSQHEDATIIGRHDIRMLLHQKVSTKQISPELAESFLTNAKKRFTLSKIKEYCYGSTYVSFDDMIEIHLHESSDDQEIEVKIDDPDSRHYQFQMRRPWQRIINVLQIEDSIGYGMQFQAIPPISINGINVCVTWSLFAIISSCKQLWSIIDNTPTIFSWSRWEGWILTSIQKHCFQNNCIQINNRSPFKKNTSLSDICKSVNRFIPEELNIEGREDANSFFKFNSEFFHNLFSSEYYGNKIRIFDDISKARIEDDDNETKIILIVGKNSITQEQQRLNNNDFDLRVICILRSVEKPNNLSNFQSIRFMRHGNGFNMWWKQERQNYVTIQCVSDEYIFDLLEENTNDYYFHEKIFVFVRESNSVDSDFWRMRFFESMGGKINVKCKCCDFPLIPTNKHKKSKSICNFKSYIQEDGHIQQKNHSCNHAESYICSNICCNIKICRRCYNLFPKDLVTSLIPEENTNDDNVDEFIIDDDDDDMTTISEDIDMGEIENRMNNHVIYEEHDPTLDLTQDNKITNSGFATTNAGDIPVNINQDFKTDSVSGHVIFNQVGSCLNRGNVNIHGTSKQNYIIQSLCATVPGTASPLLQPESSLFPRHFFAAAQHDKISILGARPLFLFNKETSTYGFASSLSHARVHMTNPFSTTSTDANLMCFYFDELGNKMLNNYHSRDVFKRGFVVDNKSPNGIGLRQSNKSNLSGSVDGRKMVLNLSSSQKYVKYTWFLTFTANHSEHPGLSHLHQWKISMNWTSAIPNYNNLSYDEKSEISKAMEEAYGVHVFDHWHTVKRLLLLHIKQHLTILGTITAIFARDEYQATAGNLCHNHLILAIDEVTINNDSQIYIYDLIRSSAMEIIKTDDMERLLENGLLKKTGEVSHYTKLAETILSHKCNARCMMRIGPGNTAKDFKCRKIHPVWDNPDPTKHNFVPCGSALQDTTMKILSDISLYENGEFKHVYFNPKRHIAPCNYNAKCNMSPVICDFFIGLKSMQNAQVFCHTNGLSKYVCKYICKFDEGNYVILSQDIHTGEFILSKTHLHN